MKYQDIMKDIEEASVSLLSTPSFHSFGTDVGYMEDRRLYFTQETLNILMGQLNKDFEMKEDEALQGNIGTMFSCYPISVRSKEEINLRHKLKEITPLVPPNYPFVPMDIHRQKIIFGSHLMPFPRNPEIWF